MSQMIIARAGVMLRDQWPYRGLQSSLAMFLLTDVLNLGDDLLHPVHLEDKLASYADPINKPQGSVRAFLRVIARDWFEVTCSYQEAGAWTCFHDYILWLTARLQPVTGIPLRLSSQGRSPAERALVERIAGHTMFAPGERVPILSITETTPCWCGSTEPYVACCGVDWEPIKVRVLSLSRRKQYTHRRSGRLVH